ncbi:MAG: NUDIX domain-containing protein [Synechococcales cyanobacterium]
MSKLAATAEFTVEVNLVIFSIDMVQQRLLVLVIRRREDPLRGAWSLPGTRVQPQESLEEAAIRTLNEHIHVGNLYLEQLYTFGGPRRDPREVQTGHRYLSVSYLALVRYQDSQLIAHDVEGIAWYGLQELPPLAFDHATISQYAHQRLCNKLEYSPIAFDILPGEFTLSQVYQLYETVLGSHFADYSNFRSRLLKLGFLRETGIKTNQGAGRPAALYRFDHSRFERVKNKPLLFV